MSKAIDTVNFEGVYWRDIKWASKRHAMGPRCDCCGHDGAEGHANACRYLESNQQSPAGRAFLVSKIREAVERDRAAGKRKGGAQ